MAGRVRVVASAFAAGVVLLAACTSGPAPAPPANPPRSAAPGGGIRPERLPPGTSSVVVSGDRMFAATDAGVTVFRVPCPEAGCRPLGRLRVPEPLIAGYPRPGHALPADRFRVGLSGGTLFVVAEVDLGEGSGIVPGRVLAYDPACDLPCGPLWRTPPGRGLELPAVHGDRTYVGASTGLAAYERCPRDGSVCRPAWTAPMNTRRGLMRMHAPVVRGRYVLALTEGCVCGADSDAPMLAAFPVRCEGRCRPLWSARLPGRFADGPVARGGSVYVSAAGGLLRFPLACSGTCRPSARFVLPARAFPRAPVLLGGFLLAPTYGPSRVSAFRATCTGRCEPVATWGAEGGLRAAVGIGGHLVVLAGRTVTLLPAPGEDGTWRPESVWDLPRKAGTLTEEGGIARVTGEGWMWTIPLP
ncbi:MAG: hypothetical protein KatS3mg014_2593 [Actinomycetota bacterium]|nr:MAG: hypothetical protein KatS3mg014_2593 [Actinomycetota bacterium]